MSPQPLPPVTYLHEALEICPISPSGLRWRSRPRNHFNTHRGWCISKTRDAGNPAGHKVIDGCGSQRFSIKLNQLNYPAHRVVYALANNVDPWPQEVDHINRIPSDNRPENLRVATRSENASNKNIQSNNTSGVRGVVFCKKTNKWQAQIGKDRKTVFLGRFLSKEEAERVRLKAEKQLHGLFQPIR